MAPETPETFVIKPKETKEDSNFPADFIASAPGYNLHYARAILIGLQNKHIYGGSVSLKEKEKRRVRNRIAKHSRRLNRP